VNTRQDPKNCGKCGNQCTQAERCSSGVCTNCSKIPGHAVCSGQCTDVWFKLDNCGACGRSCPAASYCFRGKCCLNGQCE
jgi:hypothetical protein